MKMSDLPQPHPDSMAAMLNRGITLKEVAMVSGMTVEDVSVAVPTLIAEGLLVRFDTDPPTYLLTWTGKDLVEQDRADKLRRN